MIDVHRIERTFLDRGVYLNGPATPLQIEDFERTANFALDGFLKRMYYTFNGFRKGDFDTRSSIMILPLTEIIKIMERSRLPYIPFADFEFGSEIYEVNASDSRAPIIEKYDGRVVFSSLSVFFESIA